MRYKVKSKGNIIWVILSVALGALFLYSAYTKAFPIHTFEASLETFLSLQWFPSAIIARTFVGLEAGIGVLLVHNLYGRRKWVLKLAFVLLVAFSLFLVYLRLFFGNHVNCGCFGDAIWMSPVAALVKNVFLLLITGLLLRYHAGWQGRVPFRYSYVLLGLAVVSPFVALPFGYKLDMTPLYTSGSKDMPVRDLRHGKQIIAFVHPYCGYCRKASFSMHQMRQQDTTLPLYLFIGGTESDLTDYWKATQAQDVPHSRLAAAPFLKYTGGSYPLILWVDDGKVVAESGYNELKLQDVERWLKKGR